MRKVAAFGIAIFTMMALQAAPTLAANQPTEPQPQQQAVAPPGAPLPAGNASNKPGVDLGADPMGMYLDESARTAHPKTTMAENLSHWYADPNNYHPFNKVNWHKDDCFPVSRRAYDQRGQQVTDTARMCYRDTGLTYIQDGSHKAIYETDVAGPR